jgi:hypothetical protein
MIERVAFDDPKHGKITRRNRADVFIAVGQAFQPEVQNVRLESLTYQESSLSGLLGVVVVSDALTSDFPETYSANQRKRSHRAGNILFCRG